MALPVSRPSGGVALAAAVDAHYREYGPHEVQEQMHTYAQVDVALTPREVDRREPGYGTPGILQGRPHVLEGEQHGPDERRPDAKPVDSRQQVSAEIQLLDHRRDQTRAHHLQDDHGRQYGR